MRLQIKKWGDSKVLILPKEFLKYLDCDVDDWVNASDVYKDNPKRESYE